MKSADAEPESEHVGLHVTSSRRWPVYGRDDRFLPAMRAMMRTEWRSKPGK